MTRPHPTGAGRRFTETAWFNAIWFQGTWLCAVLGRDELLPLTLALLVLHLAWVRNLQQEVLQLSTIAALGIAVDACLSYSGVFRFANDALVPLWLCCVWLAFATVPGRSLAYLAGRPRLAALVGAVALPLNYWAGRELGAVEFGYSLPVTLGTLALVWVVLLPVLYRLTALIASARYRAGHR